MICGYCDEPMDEGDDDDDPEAICEECWDAMGGDDRDALEEEEWEEFEDESEW